MDFDGFRWISRDAPGAPCGTRRRRPRRCARGGPRRRRGRAGAPDWRSRGARWTRSANRAPPNCSSGVGNRRAPAGPRDRSRSSEINPEMETPCKRGIQSGFTKEIDRLRWSRKKRNNGLFNTTTLIRKSIHSWEKKLNCRVCFNGKSINIKCFIELNRESTYGVPRVQIS